MSNIIDVIEKENLRTDLPDIKIGQTVKVWFKIKEGNKERLQAFEGVVIARKNGSVRETFTVRRLSFGIGVERTFPFHSPKIDHIDIVRTGKVRRAKLNITHLTYLLLRSVHMLRGTPEVLNILAYILYICKCFYNVFQHFFKFLQKF